MYRKIVLFVLVMVVAILTAGCATYNVQVDGKDVEKGKIVIEHRNTYVPAYGVGPSYFYYCRGCGYAGPRFYGPWGPYWY